MTASTTNPLNKNDIGMTWLHPLFDRFPRRRVWDIGACTGGYVGAWLSRGVERVLAVEPVPWNFAQLSVAYSDDPRVTCARYGVSDRSVSTKPYRVRLVWTLKEEDEPSAFDIGDNDRGAFEMEVVTPMWLMSKYFEPDFLKIDVDGYEPKIWRGLRPWIDKRKPIVHMELNRYCQDLGECCECFVRDIYDAGYRVWSLTMDRGHDYVYDVVSEFPMHTTFDVLLIHRDVC